MPRSAPKGTSSKFQRYRTRRKTAGRRLRQTVPAAAGHADGADCLSTWRRRLVSPDPPLQPPAIRQDRGRQLRRRTTLLTRGTQHDELGIAQFG